MNFLISNDDGIGAIGIQAITKALSAIGTCYVFAPYEQQSVKSHSFTVKGRHEVRKYNDFEGAEEAYSVSGTPADCVRMGCVVLKERGINIDLVVSGINHGGNVGTDTIYSGTIGAAMEGNLLGYPAVALSVCNHTPEAKDFEYICDLAVKLIKETAGKLTARTTISINTPDLPASEIKGVKVKKLGPAFYIDSYVLAEEKDGVMYYDISSDELTDKSGMPDDLDVSAIDSGYATVTPLHYDWTDESLFEQAEEWVANSLKPCK